MSESVLAEAERLINGPKRDAYGPVKESFDVIAMGWEVIIGAPVSAMQVTLCMAWLKICREVNKHQRDNLVDLAGYAGLGEHLAPESLVQDRETGL